MCAKTIALATSEIIDRLTIICTKTSQNECFLFLKVSNRPSIILNFMSL